MKKRLLATSLILFLAFAIALQVSQKAFAEHNPSVYWTNTGTDHMIVSSISWPSWFTFTAKSLPIPDTTVDSITRIKFVIPRDISNNLVLFHFTTSSQPEGWSGTPDEFDAAGWPGVVIFEARTSPGIAVNQAADFSIQFSEGPSVCNYNFAVYTVDSIEKTQLRWLYLTIDDKAPEITTLVPPDDPSAANPIVAIWDPYPLRHYITMKVAAKDTGTHDTGITRIEIWIDRGEGPVYVFYPRDFPIDFPTVPISFNHYGLAEGRHTVTAAAFDGAGNRGAITNVFTYHIPRLFVLDPAKGSVGPLTTYNPVTNIYTGSIVTFGGEQFGTTVRASGLPPAPPLSKGFTPNSYVDITIEHPLWGRIYVARNIATGTRGEFQVSFAFPTGPYGIYKIVATDRGEVMDYAYFEVVPKIAFNPPIVTGPALIEAMGTGLPGNGDFSRFMVDDTDSLLTANTHVLNTWHTYDNGTLYTNMAYKPGFMLPVLENGEYMVKLWIANGWYWNGIEGARQEIGPYEASDTVKVANDIHGVIELLNELKPIIVRIDGNVVEIKTEAGKIETKLDDIKPVIADIQTKVGDIQSKVVTIQTIVGTISGTVGRVEADCIQINTTVGTIWIKIKDVDFTKLAKLDQLPAEGVAKEASVQSVKNNVDQSALTIPIGAVLSAIAAIAAVIAAVVVVRRLKVAS